MKMRAQIFYFLAAPAYLWLKICYQLTRWPFTIYYGMGPRSEFMQKTTKEFYEEVKKQSQ